MVVNCPTCNRPVKARRHMQKVRCVRCKTRFVTCVLSCGKWSAVTLDGEICECNKCMRLHEVGWIALN